MRPLVWSEVEQLFHAALERAPAAREAFLAEACRGDEALRREVLSLLAEQPAAERLLERPALDDATQRLAVVPGTRLGPYEVSDLIGVGGMGEVYRARDERLDRDVALKVLPEHVARDPEALARFDREARAVAALSHPHIASLFDIGETGGTHYLVMELLEGETLAARLRRGPLGEREGLRLGAEIAEALGAAHAHGVVHRDVKPANVMLTAAGAKLLDFGIAHLPPALPSPGEAASATDRGTSSVAAGTLPYMAPELLEGRVADARSDVWALGCVLFEMLTGSRAFDGASPPALIAAIEEEDTPSIAARRPGASAALDRLVRGCLRKDPAERWSSAQDLALQLRELAAADAADGPMARRSRAARLRLPAAAAVLALAFLLGWWVGHRPGGGGGRRGVVRSSLMLPPEAPLQVGRQGLPTGRQVAVSPDGAVLAWSGGGLGGRTPPELRLLALRSGETQRVRGTEGAGQPFFSPDGRWIGFFARGRLFKIAVDGPLPIELAEVGNAMGAVWSGDGRILLGSVLGGLRSVPESGGPLREVTAVDPSREVAHRLPSLLPDGTVLLTVVTQLWGLSGRVEAFSPKSAERKVLVEDGADARYLPSGHLVYARRGVLMAAPFDAGRLELAAPPVPVVDGVQQALNLVSADNSGAAQYATTDSGLLVYGAGGIFVEPPMELALVDRSGRVAPLAGFDSPLVAGGPSQLRFSPDGRHLAFVERAPRGRLWLFDLGRQTLRALSREGLAGSPEWSPDGTRVAVSWSRTGHLDLWIVPVEGTGGWERLTDDPDHEWGSSWSPDGSALAFARAGDILVHRFADRRTLAFRATRAWEEWPRFSPDGRWLAYVSGESGRSEVYVSSFPDGARTVVASSHGGFAPAWSDGGRELLYRSLDGRLLMSVRVTSRAPLALGRPEVLLRAPAGVGPELALEPHPDGRRFLFPRWKGAERPPPEPLTRLQLVQNWFAEVERLAPVR
jgi:serine/threonine-protein kinase